MTALEYSEVANALRIALPEFAPAIDEHVAHNDEVLPHVLFGDLTRFVLEASRQRNDDLTRRALAFLDISHATATTLCRTSLRSPLWKTSVPGTPATRSSSNLGLTRCGWRPNGSVTGDPRSAQICRSG